MGFRSTCHLRLKEKHSFAWDSKTETVNEVAGTGEPTVGISRRRFSAIVSISDLVARTGPSFRREMESRSGEILIDHS